jgi:CDP-diacylglycerol--glycerol-3-phosphate 3-phosphatidyltransferase
MNLPNKLTLTRMALSPVFMIFFLYENLYSRYAAFLVFVIASLTDLYDGYLARRTGIVTSFGKFMDPLADKLLTSMALISFLALGLPYVVGWMVVVIVAREFLITGLRTVAAYRGLLIPSSSVAKVKTVFQMVLINVTLVHILVEMTHERFGTPVFLLGENRFEGFILLLLVVTMVLTLSRGLYYLMANREFIKRVLR